MLNCTLCGSTYHSTSGCPMKDKSRTTYSCTICHEEVPPNSWHDCPVVASSEPKHYSAGKISPLDFILDQQLGFCLGNVVKYICRCEHKGDKLGDLKKARDYIDRAIQAAEEES